MPKNTFISLLVALGGSILGGIVTLLLTCLLLHNSYTMRPGDFFDVQSYSLLVGIILCFVVPFFVCIGFLVPLAAIDKTKIESHSLKVLLTRYTPLIALPAGVLFLSLLCRDFEDDRAPYFITTLLFTVTGISFSALWFFLHRLKHKS